MRLIDRLNLLDHRDWSEHVSIIEVKVKAELQGSGGFIRAIKIDTDSDSLTNIDEFLLSHE